LAQAGCGSPETSTLAAHLMPKRPSLALRHDDGNPTEAPISPSPRSHALRHALYTNGVGEILIPLCFWRSFFRIHQLSPHQINLDKAIGATPENPRFQIGGVASFFFVWRNGLSFDILYLRSQFGQLEPLWSDSVSYRHSRWMNWLRNS
jgi:hypothetical protein